MSIPELRRRPSLAGWAKPVFLNDAPVPELEFDMALVRNISAALNPDRKLVDLPPTLGVICGGDFCGVLAAVGDTNTSRLG
jgi:hypothetical protein